MKPRLLILLALTASVGFADQYYYTDDLTNGINYNDYTQNGTWSYGSQGFRSTTTDGASIISTIYPGSGNYQIYSKLRLVSSGGVYAQYLHATSNARSGPSASGEFYSVELETPTFSGGACAGDLAVYHRRSDGRGGYTTSVVASTEVVCRDNMEIRTIIKGDKMTRCGSTWMAPGCWRSRWETRGAAIRALEAVRWRRATGYCW